MNRTETILAALAVAPMTNADLQDLLETHNGDVARTMAKLRHRGRVGRRIVKGKAIYALLTDDASMRHASAEDETHRTNANSK